MGKEAKTLQWFLLKQESRGKSSLSDSGTGVGSLHVEPWPRCR